MTLYYSIERQECPHCGKVMRLFRFGAMLTPIKAQILDLIAKRPGIRAETIMRVVLEGKTSRKNVIVHVAQINDALAHTDYFIESLPEDRRRARGGYRLMKRRTSA